MNTGEAERPTRALLWLSLLQGACLYHLYGAAQAERWPATAPAWYFPLWTLAVFSPLMLLLSVTRNNWKAVSRDVLIVSVVLGLLGTYVGTQAEPNKAFPTGSLIAAYGVTLFIASFKAVIHIQSRAEGRALSYGSLFTNSWRTFLIGALGAAFALIFWLVLLLWGALFDAIGVDFFSDLFRREWFAIPSLTLAFGIGVLVFRSNTRVIDNITQLLHSLLKLLLPLLVLLSSIFLLALPFTGLGPLWDTGNGTALLLWLLALLLFFSNAVYQDGREANPYSPAVHRGIYLGLCTTPVVSALACYGLVLRLQEYGWTVERCWGFVTWLVLSLFAAGYVVGVIRRRNCWTEDLARTNTAMSLVVLAIMLLANSPLMDFRKISLASQIQRVESGEIALKDFDFYYAEQQLAGPGYRYRQQLLDEIGDSDPELRIAIEEPRPPYLRARNSKGLWETMQYRPDDMSVPEDLRTAISKSVYEVSGGTAVLIARDLDEDDEDEYVLIQLWANDSGIMRAWLFYRENESWLTTDVRTQSRDFTGFLPQLLEAPVSLRDRRFKDLQIGGIRLSINVPSWSGSAPNGMAFPSPAPQPPSNAEGDRGEARSN